MINGSPIFDHTLMVGSQKIPATVWIKGRWYCWTKSIERNECTLSKRMQQIIVNMERCRWIDNDPPGNHLVVNIPQFQLLVYENDSLMWSCNVVVGKEIHKTAIFQGTVRYIVFSPYWNVPSSILNKEIMPAVKKEPQLPGVPGYGVV